MTYRSHAQDLDIVVAFLGQALTDQDPFPRAVITHSLRVGLYLEQQRWPRPIVLAGLLHEVVEDSDVSRAIIAEVFGPEVAQLVAANHIDPHHDQFEQTIESMQRCKCLGQAALIVKAADLLDHVEHGRDDAKPESRAWLSRTLETFLDLSMSELVNEPVWHSLQARYVGLATSAE